MRTIGTGETLDYIEDYSAEMAATSPDDTIATSTFAVVGSGLTVDSNSKTDTTTKVWITATGPNYTYATVINTITTAGGRTFVRYAVFDIRPVECD